VSRSEESKRALEAEVARWSVVSSKQLVEELSEGEKEYQIEFNAKQFQVEVQLVENTPDYIHVVVSIDDGSLLSSLLPATRGFVKKKNEAV
jgi:hypothetical protein